MIAPGEDHGLILAIAALIIFAFVMFATSGEGKDSDA
jgi:hypothetical protein